MVFDENSNRPKETYLTWEALWTEFKCPTGMLVSKRNPSDLILYIGPMDFSLSILSIRKKHASFLETSSHCYNTSTGEMPSSTSTCAACARSGFGIAVGTRAGLVSGGRNLELKQSRRWVKFILSKSSYPPGNYHIPYQGTFESMIFLFHRLDMDSLFLEGNS